jgi:hypothetical protein
MKIHYEPHPVSAERKAELRGQGFKIIDARFAPKGGAPKPVSDNPLDAMSDDAIRDEIERLTGERPHHKTGRAKLIALWEANY